MNGKFMFFSVSLNSSIIQTHFYEGVSGIYFLIFTPFTCESFIQNLHLFKNVIQFYILVLFRIIRDICKQTRY